MTQLLTGWRLHWVQGDSLFVDDVKGTSNVKGSLGDYLARTYPEMRSACPEFIHQAFTEFFDAAGTATFGSGWPGAPPKTT